LNTFKNLLIHCQWWALPALALIVAGCVHKPSGQDTTASASQVQVLEGTILHKSSRLQTITLLETGNQGHKREQTVFFDFRTRGMEYVARNKKVTITCRKQDRGDKSCKARAIVPADSGLPDGIEPISALDLKKKIDANRDITLVDTRPAAAYQACHIPGAVSVPACAPNARTRLDQLDHDTSLVLYCGWPDCSGSLDLARLAVANKKALFDEVRILEKGLDGWVNSQQITVASDDFVLSGRSLVLDVRPARKNTVQRISGSISLPLSLLAKRMNELPPDAPIVIYSDALQESRAGLDLLRENGYNRAAMVEGDIHGWKKRGNPVTSGPITTTVHWQRPRRHGAVSAAELSKKIGRRDIILLDLRTDAERQRQGIIRGSLALPLASLYKKMDTLDRRKTIYCLSGPRGALAREILDAHGFTALFLPAQSLQCDGSHCTLK